MYKCKPVVLMFVVSTGWSRSRDMVEGMGATFDDFVVLGVDVLAVSRREVAGNVGWMNSLALPYEIWSSLGNESFLEYYDAPTNTETAVLLDEDGFAILQYTLPPQLGIFDESVMADILLLWGDK